MTALALAPEEVRGTDATAENKIKVLKNRVQFDLPPRSMERLIALKDKTEASSYAEVMKNALRLFEAVIEEAEKGNEFLIQNKNGSLVPFRIFV